MKTKESQTSWKDEQAVIWAAVSSRAQDRYSIEDQLKLMRNWCEARGVSVVSELVVRGFSRDYWTLADVVAAASKDQDMIAFAELQQHIRRKSFSLFICFDADRFGRTTSLVHEVIGRITRDCKARIVTLFDNTVIDAENAPMIGTLKALKAQQDIDKLKEYHQIGRHNRARDGKYNSARMPLFLKRVRNEKGKETGVIVNEELRSLWTDLATIFLQGVSWEFMEIELFNQFGHGVNGKPHSIGYMRHLLLNPSFWGHAAINYRTRRGESMTTSSPWIWDENVEPPPGITVYRNVYPAVYSGEWAGLGEQVRHELWRRHYLYGKARSSKTYRFSGLLVCNECGYTLSAATSGGRVGSGKQVYMRCTTRFKPRKAHTPITCNQVKYLKEQDIQAYFHDKLQSRLDGTATGLLEFADESVELARRIEEEERRLAALEKRMDVLVMELANAPEAARVVFRQHIEDTAHSIDRTTSTLQEYRGRISADNELMRAQAQLIALLREKGVDWLWTQDDTFIHQQLRATLGRNQLVVRDGEIIGTHPIRARNFHKSHFTSTV